jgi:hypothetical protein
MFELLRGIIEYPHSGLIGSLVFLLIALRPKNLYKMWVLSQKIERGDPLPDKITSFPIQATSLDNYLNSKNKVSEFLEWALRGQSCQIELSADEINHLYLQGEQINKYNANIFIPLPIFRCKNKYSYFQIVGNSLLEKSIQYPNTNGIDGIVTATTEYRFKKQNQSIMRNVWSVEFNGKRIDSESNWTDEKFDFLRSNDTLLHGLFTGDFVQAFYDENDNKGKLISSVIEKITSVEIADGHLTIKVEQ